MAGNDNGEKQQFQWIRLELGCYPRYYCKIGKSMYLVCMATDALTPSPETLWIGECIATLEDVLDGIRWNTATTMFSSHKKQSLEDKKKSLLSEYESFIDQLSHQYHRQEIRTAEIDPSTTKCQIDENMPQCCVSNIISLKCVNIDDIIRCLCGREYVLDSELTWRRK